MNKPGGYDVWDFVEQFHPNYHTSEGAHLSNDLTKIIADDWKDSASCRKLVQEIEEEIQWTNGWLTPSSVIELAKRRQAVVNASIFQDTIENFIQIMKGK